MTDEPQPDLRWAPLEPKPRNRGRVWLIVGLVVAALVIVGVLLFFLLPRGESPTPGASGSPSPSASPSASPSMSPSASPTPIQTEIPQPTAAPEPTTPITTPPPAADPSVDAFRGQVRGWLDDALTGLQIVSETSGQDATAVIANLQADAQRLGETAPPSSIESAWGAAVNDYNQTLSALRSDAAAGTPTDVDSARSAANALRDIVGL
ncbi:hypothetical protein ASF87_12490 [Microbacterium sp. Leaf161]|uniref:hypothetical protein n=1 Tax=Microbacterium sp. Leaf161 TaxID=1736281 RepID=UPI0006F55F65|nr:hypothetical protein [Microbacterium sp. Leaf161]KQR49544.1 hypothetical protein ASF87_12490 [Microbacterium sp. Leaf161]